MLIGSAVLFVGLFINFSGFSCNVEDVLISNDISSYEKSPDPKLCETITKKIQSYNDDCESQIPIFTCS